MLDGGFEIDIEGICENIEEASVISIYFPMLRRTLLLDTRSGKFVRPYIGVVPMVRNARERFESLKRLRPRLPRPDSITLIPSAGGSAAGVWEHVVARLDDIGGEAELARARDCLAELCSSSRNSATRSAAVSTRRSGATRNSAPRRPEAPRVRPTPEHGAHRAGEPGKHIHAVEIVVTGERRDRAALPVYVDRPCIRMYDPYETHAVAQPHQRLVVDLAPAVAG